VFFFAALLAYLKASRNPQLYFLSLPLFLLAVLSKTVACSMPAVMLLLIWWKRGRIEWRDIARLAPFFVIGLMLAIFTSYIERNWIHAQGPEWALTPVQRLLIAGRAVWFYVFKLLWPAKLTFIYPRWSVSAGDVVGWVAVVGIVIVLALLFALRRRIGRGPIVAALIYLGVLLPALGFFNFYPQRYSYVADHFQYLASAALIALIVAVIANRVRHLSGATPYIVAGAVLLTLAGLTFARARVYVDKLALWRDTVAKNPGSWMAQNSLGASLMDAAAELPPDAADDAVKMLEEAGTHFAQSVALRPDNDRAMANWGRALILQHKDADALAKIDAALAIDSDNIEAWMTCGVALSALNRPADARTAFESALKVAEAHRDTTPAVKIAAIHLALARHDAAHDRRAEAKKQYQQAIALAPRDASIHREYAALLIAMKDLKAAAVELDEAIRLLPSAIESHVALAELRLEVNNRAGAYAEWRNAGRLASANPNAVTPDLARRMLSIYQRLQSATQPSTTRSTTTRSTSSPTTTR
jgi:Tfp pilus assembly protein PilF